MMIFQIGQEIVKIKMINIFNLKNEEKENLLHSFSQEHPEITPKFQEVLNGMDQMFPREKGYKPYEFRNKEPILWLCAACGKEYGEKVANDRNVVNDAAGESGYNDATHGMCPQHYFEYYGDYLKS